MFDPPGSGARPPEEKAYPPARRGDPPARGSDPPGRRGLAPRGVAVWEQGARGAEGGRPSGGGGMLAGRCCIRRKRLAMEVKGFVPRPPARVRREGRAGSFPNRAVANRRFLLRIARTLARHSRGSFRAVRPVRRARGAPGRGTSWDQRAAGRRDRAACCGPDAAGAGGGRREGRGTSMRRSFARGPLTSSDPSESTSSLP